MFRTAWEFIRDFTQVIFRGIGYLVAFVLFGAFFFGMLYLLYICFWAILG